MPRDVTIDSITDTLIQRYVLILANLAGWGTLASGAKAVYPHLGLPFPQEPFPAGYVYLAGVTPDQTQGTGIRRDVYAVTVRIIGGPGTPNYRVNAESAAYQMVTGVLNELFYRPYLQDPTAGQNNAPFRYVDPNGKLKLGNPGRITNIAYADQGGFIGIEIPTTIALIFDVGRVS